MSHPERSWGKAFIDFFASLRLTIFLLILLSVTSIFGTVIPQGDIPHEYLHGINQTKLKLYQALDLFDMYHSWWFITILTLFTINLIVCSVRRLPNVWRYISSPSTVLDEPLLAGLKEWQVVPLAGKEAKTDNLRELIARKYGTVTVTERDGATHLFAEKNSSSRLAVYATHLSIVIIFIGSIIGSVFGYKGFVTINEGEMISTVQTRSGEVVELDFALGLDDFSVSFYPSGAPKEFKSVLTVVGKDGAAVPGFTKVPIIVNDPLIYKGLTFYQSSYGTIGDHSLSVASVDGKTVQDVLVPNQGTGQLPDGSIIRVAETTQDVSQFIPGKHGAAAQIEIQPANGGQGKTAIIFANHPEENIRTAMQNGGPVIGYNGMTGVKEYTGLQVAKDPGVWVVWAGCLLMILGIYGAFLMSHRRIWIRITGDDLTVAGHASKNPAAFSTEFEELAAAVRKQISEEK